MRIGPKATGAAKFFVAPVMLFTMFFLNATYAQEIQGYHLEAEIVLSDEELLGALASIAIGENGEFAVVDATSSSVHLFRNGGDFVTTLDHRECDPELQWDPLSVHWISEAELAVVSGGRPGLLVFNNSGECVDSSRRETPPPTHIAVCQNADMFGLYQVDKDLEPNPGIYRIDKSGKREKAIYKPEVVLPNISRRVSGLGGLVCIGDNLIYAQPLSPTVQVLSMNGDLLRSIDVAPHNYSVPSQDLSSEMDFMAVMQQWNALRSSTTFLMSVHQLEMNSAIVQYQYAEGDGYGFVEVGIGKESREKYERKVEWPITTTKNGRIYRLKNAVIDENGNFPNPSIQVFTKNE